MCTSYRYIHTYIITYIIGLPVSTYLQHTASQFCQGNLMIFSKIQFMRPVILINLIRCISKHIFVWHTVYLFSSVIKRVNWLLFYRLMELFQNIVQKVLKENDNSCRNRAHYLACHLKFTWYIITSQNKHRKYERTNEYSIYFILFYSLLESSDILPGIHNALFFFYIFSRY